MGEKEREKAMKQTMGELEFWNTTIQECKAKARKEQDLKKRVLLAKCLNQARGWLKYAESKILVIVLLAIMLCSGCASAKGGLQFGGGIMKDLGWLATELGDNITVDKEK